MLKFILIDLALFVFSVVLMISFYCLTGQINWVNSLILGYSVGVLVQKIIFHHIIGNYKSLVVLAKNKIKPPTDK